ncbi:MAG TPA: TIGR03032 family protein [Gemmataceae bacterium]|nr:TIGR03032 family protein [Gemmataceae bacterium]
MADEVAEPKPEAEPLRSVHTTTLPQLLNQGGFSFLVSTYQAGKLIVVRADGDVANTHFRTFETPMGLAFDRGRLAIGTRLDVREFHTQAEVARQLEPTDKHDAAFLPRHAITTGQIAIHEVAWATDGLWIVNTRFSCLCTLDPLYSFVPRWRPKFITALGPEDRCHLNGLALRDGKPRYVTALGETDDNAGWRANKATGGCLIDIESNEFIARGLSMPHSPRWYDGKLWVLESGAGSLATVDLNTGQLTVVALVPGFTRGLDFYGPYAFIGLSQVRETAVFSGIPITERLPVEERKCGVWVVDTRSGNIVAFLRFEAGVQEIFAVQTLPGLRYPDVLTEDQKAVASSFLLPDEALAQVSKRPIPEEKAPAKNEKA